MVSTPSISDVFGNAALFWAAKENRLDIVRILVEAEANMNIANEEEGFTGFTDGASVNDEDGGYDMTAIHYAAQNGQSAVVEVLVENGAWLESNYADEMTPLMLASQGGHCDTMLTLMNLGAQANEVNEVNWEGYTALHHAAASGQSGAVALLVAYGADITVTNDHNQTPAVLASNHPKIVQLLKRVSSLP